MISQMLNIKLAEAYKWLDDAYVQAAQDSLLTFDKETIKLAKELDRCIVILDKARGWKK